MSNILIAGAGQLGSRYLQGLSGTSQSHHIFVYDLAQESLKTARERYDQVKDLGQPHHVYYLDDLEQIPLNIDLAIVTTDSLPRADLIREIESTITVRYWLLEKVLAPSTEELKVIYDIVSRSEGSWVNHWFRLPVWFRELKTRISRSGKDMLLVHVSGGDVGIACNATHFMDYVQWIAGEEVSAVSTENLANAWEPSKRNGYFEVYGRLSVEFKNRAILNIESDHGSKPVEMTVTWGDSSFKAVFSDDGVMDVSITGEESVSYPFPYQSQMTAEVVDSIMEYGTCNLPNCSSSIAIHTHLLTALIAHWNIVHCESINRLRIT
jgi:predicted dehydrogenase